MSNSILEDENRILYQSLETLNAARASEVGGLKFELSEAKNHNAILISALQGLLDMTEGKGQLDCWDKARSAIKIVNGDLLS